MRDILLEYVYPVIADIIEEFANIEYTEPIIISTTNLDHGNIIYCHENINYEISARIFLKVWFIYAPFARDIKFDSDTVLSEYYIIREELPNKCLEMLKCIKVPFTAFEIMQSIKHTLINNKSGKYPRDIRIGTMERDVSFSNPFNNYRRPFTGFSDRVFENYVRPRINVDDILGRTTTPYSQIQNNPI